MKQYFIAVLLIFCFFSSYGQVLESPCSHEAILERLLEYNHDAENELKETEKRIQEIIKHHKNSPENESGSKYIIPVVMHVFHYGDDGKMGMDQALSGLEILNEDFNGLNDGWDTIDEEFDSIKATLDITFCLATIDPEGNPTSGINYIEDEEAMLNRGNLFQYAWDNYKYLNIYFPKYTRGEPSDFTAYAYYPSTSNADLNRDGMFYSSVRWGYGEHSILDEGDDWASVGTHETGHWLNLRHTFQNGCTGAGDYVDDTPPTLGGAIEKEGCNNNDFSCGVHTNGENFMNYNHRCKKMFTQGQIERMTAALYVKSRINHWTKDNLAETGCSETISSNGIVESSYNVQIYPSPAIDILNVDINSASALFNVYSSNGKILNSYILNQGNNQIGLDGYCSGVYFYTLVADEYSTSGKIVRSDN